MLEEYQRFVSGDSDYAGEPLSVKFASLARKEGRQRFVSAEALARKEGRHGRKFISDVLWQWHKRRNTYEIKGLLDLELWKRV